MRRRVLLVQLRTTLIPELQKPQRTHAGPARALGPRQKLAHEPDRFAAQELVGGSGEEGLGFFDAHELQKSITKIEKLLSAAVPS
jgi:hypothetical protein